MRVSKTDIGMLGELEDQLAMLQEHLARIKAGDAVSVKVVAPILRDLVCKYGSNPKPLLFRLANKYNVSLEINLDVPPGFKSRMSLKEFLEDMAFSSGTEDIRVTNAELIKMVADQTSVAHTDNGIDKRLYAAMGWPNQKTTANSPHSVMLVGIGYTVLGAGRRLLEEVKKQLSSGKN